MPFTNQTEEKQIERAVLVGLSCPSFNTDQDADERTMDELRALAETAGAEAVAMTLQRRPAPDARTFIGEGKAEEVKQLAEMNDASLILFDNELSPSQMSNLEELTIEGVTDVLNKRGDHPKAVLLFTVCLHHFLGSNLKYIYRKLEERFPDICFIRCYMDPIMQKQIGRASCRERV